MNQRAILYTRVSTDEQAQYGYSLRDQLNKLESYCNSHNIEVVGTYQEDHSAKTFDRPEFKKLIGYLQNHKDSVDLILCMKWDRFSRNAEESYDMLRFLKKLKIEVRAIEQPVDLSIPENKIMLAIYLSSPEVENDRRSLNTSNGMRRAIREGRWCNKAPKGYVNKRDERNKPIIIPNKEAEFIQSAFRQVGQGDKTLEWVRKNLMKEGFYCSKSQFSILLRNPVYCGKIKLRKFKEEEETLVQGIHEALITEELFYKVQDVLNRKNTIKSKCVSHTINPALPLRGFLECPRCGKVLTGSASKGNGGRYYYYHCSHGCKERIKASYVNDSFLDVLKTFEPRDDVKELYDSIVDDLLKDTISASTSTKENIEKEKKKIQSRIESLQDKLADNEISSSDFASGKERYAAQLRELSARLQHSDVSAKELKEQFEYGFRFLKHLPYIFPECPIDVQRRIIGSIFPEKFSFSENNVRTKRVNEVALLIRSINKPFSKNKTGQFCIKTKLSCLVPEAGIEPF